jgi:hypothetical protein
LVECKQRGSREEKYWGRKTTYQHEGRASELFPSEPPARTTMRTTARVDPAMMIEIEAIELTLEPEW